MNINEKFLLTLLAHTDYVHCSTDTEKFYFKPNGFDVEILIPYSHASTEINIHFIYNFDDITNQPHKETINFSIESPEKIKAFMFHLYKKYELGLNSVYEDDEKPSSKAIEKFNSMLKDSSDIKGLEDKSPYLQYKDSKENFYIDFNDSLFNYGKKIKYRPLSPLIISCYYSNGETEKQYKKVVPAYLAHEYPALAKFTKIDPVVKNIQEFSETLEKLKLHNPKSLSILNALILETELDNTNQVKQSKPKL